MNLQIWEGLEMPHLKHLQHEPTHDNAFIICDVNTFGWFFSILSDLNDTIDVPVWQIVTSWL